MLAPKHWHATNTKRWLNASCQLSSKNNDTGICLEKTRVKAWFGPCAAGGIILFMIWVNQCGAYCFLSYSHREKRWRGNWVNCMKQRRWDREGLERVGVRDNEIQRRKWHRERERERINTADLCRKQWGHLSLVEHQRGSESEGTSVQHVPPFSWPPRAVTGIRKNMMWGMKQRFQ